MPRLYSFKPDRLRSERLRRGLSMEEFAELLGISAPFLGQIERGERKPSLETFEAIVSALGQTPDSLMRGAGSARRLAVEDRIAALVRPWPEGRKKLVFKTLKYISRHLLRS